MTKAMAQATGSVKEPVLVELNQLLLDNQIVIFLLASVFLIALLALIMTMAKRSGQRGRPVRESTFGQPVPKSVEGPTESSPLAPDIAEIQAIDRSGWITRLRDGLSKTRTQLVDSLGSLLAGKAKLDDSLLEEIHEILYRSDLGVETADCLIEHLKKQISKEDGQEISIENVRVHLRSKIRDILKQAESPFDTADHRPYVILVIGVNGVGKTTSIGKLAAHFMAEEKTVLLGAGDTFRAAAIDQLAVWANRIGCDIIKHQAGSDPASVAFDTVKAAISRETDIVLIDTAGRLHNKRELMDELGKIRRVVSRDIAEAPHETWLVIDATTGQNAIQQIKAFTEVAPLTGLIVTKLDGTAKGGVVISAAEKFKLPIRFIGVGEKAADLRAFNAEDFAESIL